MNNIDNNTMNLKLKKMYHGRKKVNYKFHVSGKWVNNDSYFRFGFMTRGAAEKWAKNNKLERFAHYHFITENKPDDATERTDNKA